jgi:hypothetical protein
MGPAVNGLPDYYSWFAGDPNPASNLAGPVARCAKEQAAVGELIRAGHPEVFGLRLAADDWLKEEAILRGAAVAQSPRSACNDMQRSATGGE